MLSSSSAMVFGMEIQIERKCTQKNEGKYWILKTKRTAWPRQYYYSRRSFQIGAHSSMSYLAWFPGQDVRHGVIPDRPEYGAEQTRYPPDAEILKTQISYKYVDYSSDRTSKYKADVTF